MLKIELALSKNAREFEVHGRLDGLYKAFDLMPLGRFVLAQF
jgi:hypothetical protein